MKIVRSEESLTQLDTDAIVVTLHQDTQLEEVVAELDGATNGLFGRLIDSKDLTGKQGELVSLLAPAGLRCRQLLLVGLGERGALHPGLIHRSISAAAMLLAARPRRRVGLVFNAAWSRHAIEAAVSGAYIGCHGQDLYRSEKKRHPFEELVCIGVDDAALHAGQILGESVNLTRRLINEPPSEMYPESFAAQAQRVAQEASLDIEIWDQERLQAERCGAMLAVARGSARPPRLIILTYSGGARDAAPLALVGKGVTFDSGGLSLKPSDSMKTMKCDMAGAATVLGAMSAIARLQLPVNVLGFMGLVENMISGDSYKLGDVLKARNGKTIEVLNTDAEGRLVLADVLSVAVDRGASRIIDLATLTGACVVALGTDVAGLMTNHPSWCDAVAEAAQACGEAAWQLPMFREYGELIKSEVADIKNVGDGRWGGAITAAKFLEQFVGGKPWTHFDIAGPAFLESPKPWLDGGGTGVFVRTLVEVARREAAG